MKKRLLITMGCSWTEGVGCWDYSKMYNPGNVKLTEAEHKYQKNRFHELGWPNRVGKKLGYDKVLNLGLGGSAHSTHVKLFVERILPMDLSEWEVLVIWMMTEPTRFSFYNGLVNFDYIPLTKHKKTPLEDAYSKEIDLPSYSAQYDQLFYMKIMEQICENNEYGLLFTSWNSSMEYLYKIYPSNKYIHKEWVTMFPQKSSYYSHCKHPNEKGYEWVANTLVDGINKNHPQYKGESKKDIEWEWLGSKIEHSTKHIPPI